MSRLLRSQTLTHLTRQISPWEALLLAVAVLGIEFIGSHATDDVGDIPWVALLPLLFLIGCSLVRYHDLPLTHGLLERALAAIHALRAQMVLSLGLDFHPDRHPRLPAFTALRRAVLVMGAAALVLFPARGLLREALLALRGVPGLHTVYVLALGALWVLLLAGIAVQVPAIVLGAIEVLKGRTRLRGAARACVVVGVLVLLALLLGLLDDSAGIGGAVAALAFASLLPSVVRAVDPPGGPWLNIAFGKDGSPRTAPLGELIRDTHRLLALEALLLLCVLAPAGPAAGAAPGAFPEASPGAATAVSPRATPRVILDDAPPGPNVFPVTDLLLRLYGWSAAWLFTGGAVLAIAEFNRRRRLFDPAFERSRVLWAVPGPEARTLQDEAVAIAASGWRLVVSDRLPDPEDADLLVGIPPGLMPPCRVPLTRVPGALFLLSTRPGTVLAEADERDKAQRAVAALERLLTSTRPRFGDRGEGTFLVPQCWMVVGLTRDDERPESDRPPSMTFGQSFQSALGTRLRRFLHEVMARSGVDVFYIEDSVTPQQVTLVLETLFERHIRRAEPPQIGEQDFLGVQGVHIVLHDVNPELDGIKGVDSHLTRNAISRARIMIIGRDRRDGDDDDGPPNAGESSDQWLADAMRRLFPRLQPI